MTNRINQSYNNELLVTALLERDDTIQSVEELLSNPYLYSDDELRRFYAYKNLSQFEKDLLYLYSNTPVIEVANLYGVTKQYIYKVIKKINHKLNERH